MTRSTIVEYFGEHSKYRCGYCKSNDGSYSHGMWAHLMTAKDYQALIDRGWRRSGKYVYKPMNNLICCPAYTISCRALDFQLSKSQKKVLKRFSQYLKSDPFIPGKGTTMKESESKSTLNDEENLGGENITDFELKDSAKPADGLSEVMETEIKEDWKEGEKKGPTASIFSDSVIIPNNNKGDSHPSGIMNSDVKVPAQGKLRKAKDIRRERKKLKLLQRGIDPATVPTKINNGNEPKALEDLLNSSEEVKKKFSIVTVGVNTPEFEETFEQEYELYRNYQMNIHQDSESECTRKQFKRFLCDSPIVDSDSIYGTYHQQYYVDDQLIAVGVIDILPNCVSSVYFFYLKEFLPLSPGTLGALREIAHVRKLHEQYPSIRFYYMGFYIHSCVKMRYKGNFSPSYLLCPEEYTWHLLDKTLRERLDASKYCRFNDHQKSEGNVDVNKVSILFKGIRMTYQMYQIVNGSGDDHDEVQEYGNLVGEEAATSMLLYRAER